MQKQETSKVQPEIEQPGLSRLREAVANAARKRLPGRKSILQDGLAGLNSTLGSAPDGMSNGILAGVNPVYGLYATMIGPFVGAFFTSTQLMMVVYGHLFYAGARTLEQQLPSPDGTQSPVVVLRMWGYNSFSATLPRCIVGLCREAQGGGRAAIPLCVKWFS